jgi:hypothetical protein
MRTLIINRRDLNKAPYHHWIPGELSLLTAEETSGLLPPDHDLLGGHYKHVELIRDFNTSALLDFRATQLLREARFDRIVACHERDLLRAQRLRERFEIPAAGGQDLKGTLAFRDKVLMKEILRSRGIRVPEFRRIHEPGDLFDFVEQHGLPVVVKPIFGTGSVGVRVLRSEDDLLALCRDFRPKKAGQTADSPIDLEVEQYVDGPVYHIDGVLVGGELRLCWPSRYFKPCIEFRSGGVTGSYLLAAENPMVARLNDFVRETLRALPTSRDTVFHAEVFHSADDALTLCEVAARPAGALVADVIRSAFDVDLVRASAQLQCDITPADLRDRRLERPSGLFGWVAFPFPPASARLEALATSCPFEWAAPKDSAPCTIGQVYSDDVGSLSFISSYLLSAATEEQMKSQAEQLTSWFAKETRWSSDLQGERQPMAF